MFKLKRYLKKFKVKAIIGPFFKWLEAVFELIVPFVMAKIIDTGIANRDINYIFKMGTLMIVFSIFGLCFAFICNTIATRTAQGVGQDIRNDLYKKINTFSYSDLDRFGTPTLINRITNDVDQLSLAVAMLIRLVVRAPFLIIGATIMAMIINFKISIIFIIGATISALIYYLIMKKSVRYFKNIQKKLDKIALHTRENLSGARVVRSFSRQSIEIEKFKNEATSHADTNIKASKFSSLLNPLTYCLFNLAIVAIIWFGGVQVNIGSLTQGEVIALVNYMTQISMALVVVAQLAVIFTKANASSTRINEIFEVELSETELDISNNDVSQHNTNYKIKFDNVSFTYQGNKTPSLYDFNLNVKKGETIGIIGGTGSGKTTIINLMPRFYKPTKGNIIIDGININEYPKTQLRKKFGIVSQRSTLFKGSIKENLQWCKPNATESEIENALKLSESKKFVNIKGLDYQLTEYGKNLSGGERQRLAIARALISKPEILILDDSFSALDYQTDLKLRNNIKSQLDDTTIFIVSQRISSIRHADNIVVIDNGNIIAIGNHTKLLSNCKLYNNINKLQSFEVANEF